MCDMNRYIFLMYQLWLNFSFIGYILTMCMVYLFSLILFLF